MDAIRPGIRRVPSSKSKTDNFKALGAVDTDGDGLSNAAESFFGTDPQNPYTDGDGLNDGEEVNDYHTDPTVPDNPCTNDCVPVPM